MKRMVRLYILVVIVILQAACSPPTTPDTAPPSPLATVESSPTEANLTAPQATTAPAGEMPATEIPPAGGAIRYQIQPGESSLSYEVGEVFIDEGNRFNVAVGITSQVSGEISVDLANPQNSNLGVITADISQFASDSGRRDRAVRERFLESARFPLATFQPTRIEGLPASYQAGQEANLTIFGDLTIRETTRPVEFTTTVKIDGDLLTGQATTTILMSDFGFGPIEIVRILRTEDEVKITLQVVARPAS